MSIVLVGGVAEPRKLAWARAVFGAEVEWWESRRGRGPLRALVGRIRAQRVEAIVVLEDLVGHRHHDAVVQAAREAKIAVVYARTAGQGALRQAHAELQARLGRASARAGSVNADAQTFLAGALDDAARHPHLQARMRDELRACLRHLHEQYLDPRVRGRSCGNDEDFEVVCACAAVASMFTRLRWAFESSFFPPDASKGAER